MSERGVRALLAAVSVAGLGVSLYLLWSWTSGEAPACVGGDGGCATVQSSPYSEVLGVPVAALGLGGYAALLVSAALRGAFGVIFGLSVALAGAIFSGYLTWLELAVIEAVCQWCVASAAFMVAALLLAALRLRSAAL